MSTIALSNTALLACWSVTGRDDARAIKGRTPHSAPRTWLSRASVDDSTRPNTLTDGPARQRPDTDPITATQAAAAKSP